MAQTGFVLSDEGRTLTVLNDSGTTAIEAGDLLYTAANNDVLGGTAASARANYAGGDVKVKSLTDSATGYLTPLGVAQEDIPADGYGSMAMEGVFLHAASEAITAGLCLQGNEAAANQVSLMDEGTGGVAGSIEHKIGYALTGASTSGKFLVWKFSK